MKPNIIVYVINLDGSDERLKNVTATLHKQNINFVRFPAFDGRVSLPTSHPEYQESLALKYMGRKLTGGEIGCYFSHLKCAKAFLQTEYDFAVVLEDDMQPTENFSTKIYELIEQLKTKSWYVINIGANKSKIFTPLFKVQQHEVYHAHYFPMTTTGIIWSKKGAQAFAREGLPIYAPVDNFFRDWLTKSNLGIAVYPPLVSARDIASDIDQQSVRNNYGRTANYGFLKQKRLWRDKIRAFKHKIFRKTY